MPIPLLQHEVYRCYMLDAKVRLVAAEKVLSAATPFTGFTALDMEFCFLQIRRIIECITFSAMVREAARYESYRKIQAVENKRDHGEAAKDWEAAEILKRLVAISPHALPIPIAKATATEDGEVLYDRHKIEVNHGRLIDLYKQCGGYMHGKNPLVNDFAALIERDKRRYKGSPVQVRRALEFLRKLLWRHAAVTLDWTDQTDPKSVESPKAAWLLDFGADDTQEILLIMAAAA
jgi:hypothetical protein